MSTSTNTRDAIALNAPIGRVYGVSWPTRIFALTFLVASCFIYSRIILASFESEESYQWVVVLLVGIFPLVGAGISLAAFTSEIKIHATTIERQTLWSSKSMAFASIKGRREFTVEDTEGGSTRYVRLESNDGSPSLIFGKKRYGFDDAFWAWYRQLPNLDSEGHKDSNFGLV